MLDPENSWWSWVSGAYWGLEKWRFCRPVKGEQ